MNSKERKKDFTPNPLALFPSKSDSITGVFFKSDTKNIRRKVERRTHWLDPGTLDPKFGISVYFTLYIIVLIGQIRVKMLIPIFAENFVE